MKQDVSDQIINGVVTALWVISRPVVWTCRLLHWFVIAVAKEAGNRIVKIVAGGIVASIIIYFSILYHH